MWFSPFSSIIKKESRKVTSRYQNKYQFQTFHSTFSPASQHSELVQNASTADVIYASSVISPAAKLFQIMMFCV